MRENAGRCCKIAGMILMLGAALLGLAVCAWMVQREFGTAWAAVSVAAAPLTLLLAPIGAVAGRSNWWPFILVYGGLLLGYAISHLGRRLLYEPPFERHPQAGS